MIYEEATWQIWEKTGLTNPKKKSELYPEKYMPLARHRVSQLQGSALQTSLAKPFALIQSNVVSSLSWFGFVTKMHMDGVKII